jgi:hypothetical protein
VADPQIQVLADKITDLTKMEMDLDKAYPFRAAERSCSPQDWLAGWRKLKVDKDFLANIADQMCDPSVAATMAAVFAHPGNAEAEKLKTAVSLRNAPKTSLKELCLLNHGGSPDKFRAFMMDKAADENDAVVMTIARKCLAFFVCVEAQMVPPATSKKSSSAKLQQERNDMMLVIYHGIKAMKLRACKAVARQPLERALLMQDFNLDWKVALTKTSSAAIKHVSISAEEPALKRFRISDSSSSLPASANTHSAFPDSGKGGSGKGKQDHGKTGKSDRNKAKAEEIQALTQEFQQMMGKAQPHEVQARVDAKYKANGNLMQAFMGSVCRHCLVRSRGVIKHTRTECRASGGLPSTPCLLCAARGSLSYHWPEDCK